MLTVLAKFGKIVKVVKAFKLLKVFLTMGTMALSVFVYSFQYGLPFAFGFVSLLFVHEIGHVVAGVLKGHPLRAPIFIPFLGALIFIPKLSSSEEEAFIGYGGPLLGACSVAALTLLWALWPGQHELILLLAFTAAFLNLFNLIPISPLDGGRITQVLGPRFRYVGYTLLIGFTIATRDPGLIMIWILVLCEVQLTKRSRFLAGLALWLSMATLYAMDYGHEGVLSRIFHLLLSGFYLLVYGYDYQSQRKNRRLAQEALKERGETVAEDALIDEADAPALRTFPPPAWPVRLRWFGLYIVLVVGLASVMYALVPYLPVAARR